MMYRKRARRNAIKNMNRYKGLGFILLLAIAVGYLFLPLVRLVEVYLVSAGLFFFLWVFFLILILDVFGCIYPIANKMDELALGKRNQLLEDDKILSYTLHYFAIIGMIGEC